MAGRFDHLSEPANPMTQHSGGRFDAASAEGVDVPDEDILGPIKREGSTGQIFIEPTQAPGFLDAIQHDTGVDTSKMFDHDKPWLDRSAGNMALTAVPELLDAITPDDPGGMVLGGLRDAAVGAITAPADIASALGSDVYQPTADFIRKNIPEFRQNDAAGKIGQTITQYAAPAAGGAKIATGLTGIAEDAPGLFAKLLRWGAGVGGAATADAVVTDPTKASTLGDLVGGPTEIQPDDSNLSKRVKVGAETVALEPAVRAVGATAKGVKNVGKMGYEALRPVEKTEIGDKVARAFQDNVVDKNAAIENIDESLKNAEGTNYKPMTGSASGDPELLRLQQSLANSGKVADRVAGNEEVTAQTFNDLTQPKAGEEAVQKLKPLAEGEKTAALEPAQQKVADVQANLDKINEDMKATAANLANQQGGKVAASEQIDTAFRDVDARLTKAKNDLYKAADPDGTLRVPADDFLADVDAIKPGALEDPEAFPGGIISDIKNKIGGEAADGAEDGGRAAAENEWSKITGEGGDGAEEGATISLRDLIDLRGRISNEIGAARAKGKTSLERFIQLKEAVNKQIDGFAEHLSPEMQEAANGLRTAQDNYANTFSPMLKEGAAGKLRKAMKSGAPGAAPASETGGKFLNPGPAAKERSGQLNKIAEVSTNPGETKMAIRKHLISDMADKVTNGEKVDANRLQAWINNNRETLKNNPEVRKEVIEMQRRVQQGGKIKKQIETDLESATQGVKKTEKEFNESAAGLFLKTDDPAAAVRDAMNSGTKLTRMRQLMTMAKKDTSGQAVEGLRDLIRRELRGQLRQFSETSSGGLLKPSNAKMVKFFEDKNNLKMVEEAFADSPQDVRNLRLVRTQLQEAARKAQGTAGSITEPLKKQGEETESLIVSLFGAAHGLGGVSRARSRLNVVGFIQKALGRDPEQMARQLLEDATLDPKLAKTLLMKPLKKNQPLIEKQLRTYISNNLAGEGEERQKDNQPSKSEKK